tara:strand:- start:217 stop:426 length:210 start_codon:yes stop_codon:yes gene_type:complete
MKCVVCLREGGNDEKGVITLQSTTHGSVCPKCIDQLVGDVIKMRTPWTKDDLKEWGIRKGLGIYGSEEE